MSTKFVSKNSNYMLVLRPGVEGSRVLGTQSVPGLYVKFQAGSVDVKEEALIEMLRKHPGFGTDFIEVKEKEVDPYALDRVGIEPDHVTTEINYGHAGKKVGNVKTKISPEMRKIIEKEAVKMIPGILKSNPKILKAILSDLSKSEVNVSELSEESEPTQLEEIEVNEEKDTVTVIETVAPKTTNKPKVTAESKNK